MCFCEHCIIDSMTPPMSDNDEGGDAAIDDDDVVSLAPSFVVTDDDFE